MSALDELRLLGRRQLPLVLAAATAESGLACLVMIGRYYGHDVDLNGLRQRTRFAPLGVSTGYLTTLLSDLGFSSRVLEVEVSGLKDVATPAVLRCRGSEFVVLKGIRRGRFVIHDSRKGRWSPSASQLTEIYDGVAIEVSVADTFVHVEARAEIHLTDLWSKMKGFWTSAFQVFALSIVLQVAYFAAPFQIQLAVDQVIANGDKSLLLVLAVGFGLLAIFQAGVDALRSWALQVIGNLVTYQMIGNLIRHLLRLPADYFERRHVGDIMSRIGSTSAIQDALSRGLIGSVVDGAIALVALVLIFAYSAKLALAVVLFLVASVLCSVVLYPRTRALQQERILASAREQTFVMEMVRAATTIKTMGREAEREGTWRNLYASVTNATIALARYQVASTALQSFLANAQTAVVIYLGVLTVLDGAGFSIGMLLAFLSFRQTLTDRTNSLINQILQFRLLTLHLDRLSDIVTAKPEVRANPAVTDPLSGRIELRKVAFRYDDQSPLLLDNVDLTVESGDFLAITGPTGCGKTTLLKILQGILSPTAGEILIDGLTATPERWVSWRREMGVVSQDDRLLSGTIADNIAFFDPDADLDRVMAAAKSAYIHHDIIHMPLGYLSAIGDMGAALSGGQKQRLLLARALYRQPKILFLDEGTAHLDEDTEDEIAELVLELPVTRIVVAHRPALVQRARRVAVLVDRGLAFPKSQRSFVLGDL